MISVVYMVIVFAHTITVVCCHSSKIRRAEANVIGLSVCIAEASRLVIVVLALANLCSVFYFLQKKGKICCGRSGKLEM